MSMLATIRNWFGPSAVGAARQTTRIAPPAARFGGGFGQRYRNAAALFGAGYLGYRYLTRDPERRQHFNTRFNSMRGQVQDWWNRRKPGRKLEMAPGSGTRMTPFAASMPIEDHASLM